jgi:hypothetical protein
MHHRVINENENINLLIGFQALEYHHVVILVVSKQSVVYRMSVLRIYHMGAQL